MVPCPRPARCPQLRRTDYLPGALPGSRQSVRLAPPGLAGRWGTRLPNAAPVVPAAGAARPRLPTRGFSAAGLVLAGTPRPSSGPDHRDLDRVVEPARLDLRLP